MASKPLPERKSFTPTDFSKDERFSAKLGYYPEVCVAYNGVKVGADDDDDDEDVDLEELVDVIEEEAEKAEKQTNVKKNKKK